MVRPDQPDPATLVDVEEEEKEGLGRGRGRIRMTANVWEARPLGG